jgi:hypothetical protein
MMPASACTKKRLCRYMLSCLNVFPVLVPVSYFALRFAGHPFSMASAHHQGANALPPTILSHILQYVSLQQRLGHCALVSTAWAAGAAAATTVIEHRCDCCAG